MLAVSGALTPRGSQALESTQSGAAVRRASPSWAKRPVLLTVGYPAGGISDQIARALAEVLTARLGVAVVVENRAGASGTLALNMLARREPDGHSLCFVAATAVALRAHAMQANVTAARDVVPVAGVMRTPVLIVGTRSLQPRTFHAMVEYAKASPGRIRWATTGEGTTGHAVLERVRRASGAEIVHVPYKGGGQQLTDALAGHFEVLSTNVASAQLKEVAAGRLVALAVGASERLAVLPITPTLAELGFAGANLDSLFGIFGPPGLPAEIAGSLNREVSAALQLPELQLRLRKMNNTPFEGGIDGFEREVARQALR